MKFTVIPHVHWDREWHFTAQRSLLYLLADVDELLGQLDSDSQLVYILDAQTSLLDDYLSYRPENKERVQKYICQGRLLTGPWYTQTDQMIVHGESILKNLQTGMKEAGDLGHCFKVDYAVDCFGQAAQMPQILQGLGIGSVLFKRGIDFSKIPSTEFVWKGPAGTQVLGYHAMDYMNFRDPKDVSANLKTLEKLQKKYGPRSLSQEAFLFNGFDQHPVRHDISSIVKELQDAGADIRIQDPEKVLNSIKDRKDLPEFEGELTCGQTSRVHKSIYSSRADIKRLHSRTENEMIRQSEPLNALAKTLGLPDERKYLDRLWKVMMENAAHDAIGSCNSDKVNKQIKNRFETVLDALQEYQDITRMKIATAIDQGPYDLQVWNMLPYKREETVTMTVLSEIECPNLKDSQGNILETEILSVQDVSKRVGMVKWFKGSTDNTSHPGLFENSVYETTLKVKASVPAMGYETFTPVEKEDKACKTEAGAALESDWLLVQIQPDGTLSVTDKETGIVYDRLLQFADDADAGDSYDHSVCANTAVCTGEPIEQLVIGKNEASWKQTIFIPENLEERKANITSKPLTLNVSVQLKERRLEITVQADNQSTDHRLRALFPTQFHVDRSLADQTFGIIQRPTDIDVPDWKEKGWNERPRPIEPMQSWCAIEQDGNMLELISDSVKEYEVLDHSTLAYTLFRSFPYMGRKDLEDRPGRESGKPWATPDAMLLGNVCSTFALSFPKSRQSAHFEAQSYCTPMRTFQLAAFIGSEDTFPFTPVPATAPKTLSVFELENAALSIFKTTEKGSLARYVFLEEGTAAIRSEKQPRQIDLKEEQVSDFVGHGTVNEIQSAVWEEL